MSVWKKRESAVGVIEIILILVVLVGLVLIFKNQLGTLAQSIFAKINQDAGTILK